jgi:hypothetical protein
MKKVALFILAVFLLASFNDALAQKEKYYSLFIYNFSKYIKWPDSGNSSEFVIGVLGSPDMVNILSKTAASKTVNGADIVVKQFNDASEISDCHILFISERESSKLDEITSLTPNESILIVTDKPGLAKKGSIINFIEKDGKIKFELNQADAEARGLKVSGSLVSLAILV